MQTKRIGNIGESRALFEFVKREIPVYLPFGDNETADLLAEFNGKINKIQVKTITTINKNNALEFPTSRRPVGNNARIVYNEEEVDYFVFYCLELDKILLVPYKEVMNNKASFTIKLDKSNNKKSHYIEDFTFDKILNQSYDEQDPDK